MTPTGHDGTHRCDTGCGRPAPHTWVCWDCLDDLMTQLDAFTPEDLSCLRQVALREASPATRPATHTTHQKGPTSPLHLGADHVHTAITSRFGGTLGTLPHQPDAAHQWYLHCQTLQYARELIDGEPDPLVGVDRELAWQQIPAMTTREMVPWLRQVCNVRIHPQRIKRWAHRGKIPTAGRTPGGLPMYHPADVLRAYAGMDCTS